MADQSADYGRRDRVVCWLVNQLLRLASPKYRAMIGGSIRYGLRAAAHDALLAEGATWQATNADVYNPLGTQYDGEACK